MNSTDKTKAMTVVARHVRVKIGKNGKMTERVN